MLKLSVLAMFLAVAAACAAQPQGPMMSDVPRLYPSVWSVWRGTLSREIQSDWLAKFDGEASPIQDVTIRVPTTPPCPTCAVQMKFGTVCMPHQCGDNIAGFLFHPNGQIVAVVHLHGKDAQCNLLTVGDINKYQMDFINKKLGECKSAE
jgi:hypothetical protein